MSNVEPYLKLISHDLEEHHAALFVGAGMGRNADKINTSVPDMPLWSDLAKAFIEKLGEDEKENFESISPLKLADYVEIKFGRSVLDEILLDTIQDHNYIPNETYRKLLELPWTDIFTTNYDTLLERAADELPDRKFKVILSKEDLIGGNGETKIVKLHGSFPSTRPFIIASEDYRRYPLNFAPFVNTVQQSLLENTMCLLGFSGEDPNFEKWIGWIHDNLGYDNIPKIYFLCHHLPSEARCGWLEKHHIIPVDLSQIFGKDTHSSKEIYDATFNYLLEEHRKYNQRDTIDLNSLLPSADSKSKELKDYIPLIKNVVEQSFYSFILPGSLIAYLKSTLFTPATNCFINYCKPKENVDDDDEIEFLFEYDALQNRLLMPLNNEALGLYNTILNRHENKVSKEILAIKLSMLRSYRELGEWENWNQTFTFIKLHEDILSYDQQNQICWEQCLYYQANYKFAELKKALYEWDVPSIVQIWVLRKAGLLAECGEYESALKIVKESIFTLRKYIKYEKDKRKLSYLYSIESALMVLNKYLNQSLIGKLCNVKNKTDEDKQQADFTDEQQNIQHFHYRVSWREFNNYYYQELLKLEDERPRIEKVPSFDIGRSSTVIRFGKNPTPELSLQFLRFREESGIPFRINLMVNGNKLAEIAAKNIAAQYPELSMLTLVRAGSEDKVDSIFNRGVLCSICENKDNKINQLFAFYVDILKSILPIINFKEKFKNLSFLYCTTSVLPSILAVLCVKVSREQQEKLLDLLKSVYSSPDKLCFRKCDKLVDRFMKSYQPINQDAFLVKIASFPVITNEEEKMHFPDLFEYIPESYVIGKHGDGKPVVNIEKIVINAQNNVEKPFYVSRLLYCFYHNLLTNQQVLQLENLIWENGKIDIPKPWLKSDCLDFPDLKGNASVKEELKKIIKMEFEAFVGKNNIKSFPTNDKFLQEILSLFLKGKVKQFLDSKLSKVIEVIVEALFKFMSSVQKKNTFWLEFQDIFPLQESLWILLADCKREELTEKTQERLKDILKLMNETGFIHYGLFSWISRLFNISFNIDGTLKKILNSSNESAVQYLCRCYNIAISVEGRRYNLLSDEDKEAIIQCMVKQIEWNITRNLSMAFDIIRNSIRMNPSIITNEQRIKIIGNMYQLLDDTKISKDDTAASASDKGIIRNYCIKLAYELNKSKLDDAMEKEYLSPWLSLIEDPKEFADVRNVFN